MLLLILLVDFVVTSIIYHILNKEEREIFIHRNRINSIFFLLSLLVYVPVAEICLVIDMVISVVTVINIKVIANTHVQGK